ncbi:MAG: hypothetical protein K2H85_11075 [Allobaculum sp.]|nr:hypothetical protein [Allobaculum sp.]
MNQSFLKTCLLSGLVLCGGFTILCFLEKQSIWIGWLIGFCVILTLYLFRFHPKNSPQKKDVLQSVLSDQAKESLARQSIPSFKSLSSDFPLQAEEHLLWADQMRTDYYNSKPHLVYLTNKRLVCFDSDFSFSQPVQALQITFLPNKIKLQKNNKTLMTFQVASPKAFEQAWSLAKDHV